MNPQEDKNKGQDSWEEKFDKQFVYVIESGMFMGNSMLNPNTSVHDVKEFIRTLLASEKEAYKKELIEEIEGILYENRCKCIENGQRICSCDPYDAGKDAGYEGVLALLKK